MQQNSKESNRDSVLEASVPAVPPATTTEPTSDPTALDSNEEQERLQSESYPSGVKFVLIAIALCFAILLITLDGTIVATAVPRITDEFHSLNDVGWYGSVYFMTSCIFQLLIGKINSRNPIQWSYLASMVLFMVGSAVCGAAPSSASFIIGRAIAGLGCSGIIVGTFALIPGLVAPVKRPMFTGLIGGSLGLGTALGPLIGGALVSKVSWRWCFYINLPFAAVVAVIFIAFVRPPPNPNAAKFESWGEFIQMLDLPGLIALIPAIICLLLALQWGGVQYAWNSGRIIALLVISGVLALTFVAIEIKQAERAMVPPRIFSQRSILCACLFSFCSSGASFVLIYYVPIWFQAIQGASPLRSGVMNLPMVLASTIFSLAAGVGITLVGYYTPFMVLSSVLAAIGAGLLSTFKINTPASKWIGYQVIYGLGVGFSRQTPLIAVQTVLPLADISVGSGLIMFTQTFTGAIFISVTESLFTNKLAHSISGLGISGLDSQTLLSTGATNLGQNLTNSQAQEVLVAYNDALVDSWHAAVALAAISFLGAVFIEHKPIRGRKSKKTELPAVLPENNEENAL